MIARSGSVITDVMRAAMKEKLQACVPQATFEACWESDAPPYELFIDAAVEKISSQLDAPATEVACIVRSDGNNRVRIDGIVNTANGAIIYTQN